MVIGRRGGGGNFLLYNTQSDCAMLLEMTYTKQELSLLPEDECSGLFGMCDVSDQHTRKLL